jgi:hypothetical protein
MVLAIYPCGEYEWYLQNQDTLRLFRPADGKVFCASTDWQGVCRVNTDEVLPLYIENLIKEQLQIDIEVFS